jgi:hypothetical protein
MRSIFRVNAAIFFLVLSWSAPAPGQPAAPTCLQIDNYGTCGEEYLLITKADLLARPTSGTAWSFLLARADEAVGITLDAAAPESPWLPNYKVVAPKYLAAALVYASAWGGDKSRYRSAVEAALRHIIGSEEEASSDGTSTRDALLATCRQLSAWMLAADLIEMDDGLTGSRAGWTGTTLAAWLGTILTKKIGTSGRWTEITTTQENSASNWGAHCGAARVAVSRYRDDVSDVNRAALVFRGALGDSSAYPAYPPGNIPNAGDGFQTTAAFDSSWACNYTATIGGWRPINDGSCGAGYDGAVVEDISRSAGAYPTWDSTGISYAYETIAAHHLTAILLHRAGLAAFDWSDQALRRSLAWLDGQGQHPSTKNWSVERHISWITNYFYGTSFSTQPALYGRSLGFTDWLFP